MAETMAELNKSGIIFGTPQLIYSVPDGAYITTPTDLWTATGDGIIIVSPIIKASGYGSFCFGSNEVPYDNEASGVIRVTITFPIHKGEKFSVNPLFGGGVRKDMFAYFIPIK
jgi:hypothetical protein